LKQCSAQVRELEEVREGFYYLALEEPYLAATALPGQFLHLRVTTTFDPLLRRPFSVAGTSPQTGIVRLFFRRLGTGTKLLSCLRRGDPLDCLGPLGSPFMPAGKSPAVLLAGGTGIAPLLFLAEKLGGTGDEVYLFYGAATAASLLPVERFLPSGPRLFYVTADGSAGETGLLTDAFRRALEKGLVPGELFACGPRPFLAILAEENRRWGYPLQVSLEENMACGLGACQGCAVLLQKDGKRTYARVCREGPVFCDAEVVW